MERREREETVDLLGRGLSLKDGAGGHVHVATELTDIRVRLFDGLQDLHVFRSDPFDGGLLIKLEEETRFVFCRFAHRYDQRRDEKR